MDNVFLLTNRIYHFPRGGREMLCKLNYDILKEVYGDQCTVFELSKNSIRDINSLFYAFRGYIDGLDSESIAKALHVIKVRNIDKVFVDGSNLGEFVKIVKTKFPNIKVYTFFHNVEARFFLGSLNQNKTLHSLAVLIVNYLAEKKAVQYSDKIISINERDSHLLEKLYGRAATNLYPMSLADKLPPDHAPLENHKKEKFALFVGGTFYANYIGITWFVKHVVPQISIKTYIVGRDFKKFKNELELSGKVVVVGEVDSLAEWYHDAYFVIAPIFDGSGMKTKVAEALMYGKKIIGTQEAFSGYEEITEQAGCICLSAEEFVEAIESSDDMVNSSFDKELRKIYEENYSYVAAKTRLKSIIC